MTPKIVSGLLAYVVIGILIASIRAHRDPHFAVPVFDLFFWPLIVFWFCHARLFNGVPFFGGRR